MLVITLMLEECVLSRTARSRWALVTEAPCRFVMTSSCGYRFDVGGPALEELEGVGVLVDHGLAVRTPDHDVHFAFVLVEVGAAHVVDTGDGAIDRLHLDAPAAAGVDHGLAEPAGGGQHPVGSCGAVRLTVF